jgi:hypothetical protein
VVVTLLGERSLALHVGIAVLVVVYFGIVAWEKRSRPVALRGWDSKVTEVTPSEKIPLWALMFRLYGPEGSAANGEVACEVDVEGKTYPSKTGLPTFDSLHLQPGELPHYVAFFPPSFDGAEGRTVATSSDGTRSTVSAGVFSPSRTGSPSETAGC